MSHSADNCFGKRSDQKSSNKGLGGNLVNRDASVQQFNNSEKYWKRDIKYPRKQKKMLYIMAKRARSCR